jgi:hypothetical protein
VKHTLVLQTPRQHGYKNPAVELNPKILGQWIEGLPVLNIRHSLKQLSEAVTALNQQETPAKKRLPLLEIYRTALLQFFPSCEPDEIHVLHIKSHQRGEIVREMGVFLNALADGYKIILKEEHKQKSVPTKSTLAMLCLYRTMEMLSLSLLHAYRNHHAIHPFVFMELHQAYLYAEHHQVLDKIVIHEKKTQYGTLSELYKRIMLLATTDPFHLADGIATRLYYLTGDFTELCTISAEIPNNDSHTDSHYLIDLDGDSPPQSPQKSSDYDVTDATRVLYTGALLEAVYGNIVELQSCGQLNNEQRTKLKLLQHLKQHEIQPPAPRAERTPANNRATIAGFGINTAYYLLSQDEATLTDMAQRETPFSLHSHQADAGSLMESWGVSNESATGYLLGRQQPPLTDIHVGDIGYVLSLVNNRTRAHLTLVAVRWVKHFEHQRTEIGVEIIPGEAFPAECQVMDDKPGKEQEIQHGILLSRIQILNIPETLLTPKKIYQRGKKIKLTAQNKTMDIEAGFLSQDSSSFDRFEFRIIGEE